MFIIELLRKFYIKTISHLIKDKEKRRIYRFNKLHKDSFLFLGHSYAIRPFYIAPDTVIGKYVSIAENVCIGIGNEHPTNFVSTSNSLNDYNKFYYSKRKPCIIGNDVWIGRNAIIKNGTNIGTGSIIGMGSVVTKDVPPYAIVGGNPAKIIRYRFDEITIKKLIDSQWWNLKHEDLKKMTIKNPQKFLEEINEIRSDI